MGFKCFKIINYISIELNELLGMCKLKIKRQERSEIRNVFFVIKYLLYVFRRIQYLI